MTAGLWVRNSVIHGHKEGTREPALLYLNSSAMQVGAGSAQGRFGQPSTSLNFTLALATEHDTKCTPALWGPGLHGVPLNGWTWPPIGLFQ